MENKEKGQMKIEDRIRGKKQKTVGIGGWD